MIVIKIGKKKYKGVYSWNDITLRQFCDLAAIPMPEGYEAYIIADGKFTVENIKEYAEEVSKLTDKQINEEFPAYYRKAISCLSDIPANMKLTDDQVHEMYEFYFKPFVASLIYHTPVISFIGKIKKYQPEKIETFRIGLKRYYLPAVVRILDQDIPLKKETIVAYTEASDIFRGIKISRDDVNRLVYFMAIYCRRRNEKYDEKKVLRRKELFMRVSMSTVWAVFFCTMRQLPDYSAAIRLFGSLPKTLQEIVSAARTYRDLAAAG